MLILCILVSSVLLLLGQIEPVRDILDPMYTTIRMILAWVFVLSVVTTSSLWILDKSEELMHARKRKREDAENRAMEERQVEEAVAEGKRQALQERERISAQIRGMSDTEREIFNLVKSGGGCGVWVCKDDAGVQTLIHRGLIEQIWTVETWQDWEGGYDERAWCILVELPAIVKSVVAV